MTTRRCPPPATSATAAASQALIRQHRRRATRRDHRTAALAVERLHARAMLSASPWTVSSLDAERAAEAVLARLGGAEPATLVTIHNVEGRPMLARTAYATAAAATSALNGLRRDPRLVSVEVDQPVTLLVEPFTTTDASSDPLRGALWGLDRLGVEPVWSVTTGADVDVAVLDTGVAYHEDLAGLFGPGADFSDAGGNGRNDGHSHGTHVAGTIAATARNARGIAGVAPGVRIMPVKVLGDTGSGSAGAVAEGIIWAADNGAEVITMSLGGTTRSSAMEMAVSYALQRGVTVIAAAGNSRAWGSPLSYPAAYEGVVAVAATTPQDTVASFSTGNASVDIAAPGTGIWSTIPGDRYAAYNGTSMATPHVAAVAALVHARAADLGASVNVPGILLETARDLGAPGRDDDFGRGLVDPVAAVLAVGSTAAEPPPAPVNLQAESTWWSRATVTWSLPVDPLSVTGVRLVFANGDAAALVPGTATSAVVTGLQPQTTYTLYATSIGRTKGSERSAPITFTTPARPDFAGDSLQTAARLPTSFRVAELLDTVDDVDWWTFTLQSRLDKPEVRLTNLPSDYTVELSYEFNGRLTQLWRGLNVGTKDELSQLGRFHYWDSGRYFIKVFVSRYGTFSETQPYRLEILSNGMPLSREPAPTPTPTPVPVPPPPPAQPKDRGGDTAATATVVPLGTYAEDVIHTAGDVDYWAFDIPVSGTYTIEIEQPGGPSLRHSLILPDGRVRSSGSGTGGTNVMRTTLGAGRHLITMAATDGTSTTTKNYRIIIRPPQPATGIALMPATDVPASRDPAAAKPLGLVDAIRLLGQAQTPPDVPRPIMPPATAARSAWAAWALQRATSSSGPIAAPGTSRSIHLAHR